MRYSFAFEGFNAYIDEPVRPKAGRQWMWCMKWPGAFADRTGQINGVARGFYYVYLDDLRWMNDEGREVAKRFHDFLVAKLGFAPQANLIGMSWGGFYSARYAAKYPQDVRRIYFDAPLMNFAGFDLASYGACWSAEQGYDWSADSRMPVNLAKEIAAAKIPILLVYGDADKVVAPARNCELFLARLRAAGGDAEVHRFPGRDHHPHGFDPSASDRVVDFFEGQ